MGIFKARWRPETILDQGEEFENNQDIESVVILITTSNSTVITYALWCWKEPIPRTDRTTLTIKRLTTPVPSARLWLYCALPWPTLAAGARFEPSLPCRFINITLDIGEWIAISAVRLFTVFLRVVRNI